MGGIDSGAASHHAGPFVVNRWMKSVTSIRRFLVGRSGVIFLEYALLIGLTIIGLRFAVSAIVGG